MSLHVSPASSQEIDEAMRISFERCAKRALRRPDPIARSVVMRKILRRVVPKSLRPWAKRLVLDVLRPGRR